MAVTRGRCDTIQKRGQRFLKGVAFAWFSRPWAGEPLRQPQVPGIGRGLGAEEFSLRFDPAPYPFMRLNADECRPLGECGVSVCRFYVRKTDELAFVGNAQFRTHGAGKLVGDHPDQRRFEAGCSLWPLDFADFVHQLQVRFGQRGLGLHALRRVSRPFAQNRRHLIQQLFR